MPSTIHFSIHKDVVMDKTKKRIICTALTSLMLIHIGFAAAVERTESESEITYAPIGRNRALPIFELPKPQNEKEKRYLGLFISEKFKFTQIQTQVLIIEVFNMYCPHCQREAPRVNELYCAIDEHTGLKDKVKIIGIGAGNSLFEVDLFKKKYDVPFPLFSDKDLSITRLLEVTETPTFIGVRFNKDGSHQKLFFKSGGFGNIAQFLAQMLQWFELS
jgi:thiol-disulfide isomerase/thioredoxin